MTSSTAGDSDPQLQQLRASLDTGQLDIALPLAVDLAGRGDLPVLELFTLCAQLGETGDRQRATLMYRHWLSRTKSLLAYAVLFNYGVCLADLHDDAGAEDAYRRALAMKPDFIEANMNLATLLERTGRQEEALALWHKTIDFASPDVPADRPFHIQALNNLGRLLELRRQYPEALETMCRSLVLDPVQPKVITHVVHLRQKLCQWPVFAPLPGLDPAAMRQATSALAMLSATDDPAEQLAAAQRFVKEKVIPLTNEPLASAEGYGHRRLRIGYLSSDLCSHAVAILTAELYELHDRSKFEVYAFSWSREDGTPLRARVKQAMDHYIPISHLSDREAALLIRAHEIDILVDLHGLTLGTRPDILSLRPAPVQLTYLGFPGPTAIPGIDYVIADRFVLPPELAPHFTEKPLYMPECFQINDRQREIGPRPTRAAVGLPDDKFVFCSFNNNFKITEEMFAVWMRVLARVPDSVLWMVADHPAVRANLRAAAASAGIDPERLLFAERTSPANYLARFQCADLFLDTMPFNAGTTASDALWAGLPLLTCAGRTFSARMAGSLLHAVNMPQLITFDLQAYEDKAVELAGQPETIAGLKRQLADERGTCTLFDTPRYVRELERVLEGIVPRRARAAPDVHLYHIAYSQQTLDNVPPGYKVLSHLGSGRDDWREYWPIRTFLLGETLDDDAFYGFFSPRFAEKTGLTHAAVVDFVTAAAPDADVVTFSPQPDMGAFFLNVYEQEDLFQPGTLAACQHFVDHAGLDVALASLVMDSRQVIFSNYFVARPAFWRAWLALNEQLFAVCEGPDTPLKQELLHATNYPGAVQRKVFAMERMASLLLTLQPTWRVKAYDTFALAWSASRLAEFRLEAVLSDALKIAMREQGFPEYREAFAAMRDKLRN